MLRPFIGIAANEGPGVVSRVILNRLYFLTTFPVL